MDSKERYEKAVEGLGQAIFHLTWLGHFWGFRGVIVLDEIRSWYIIHKLCGDKSGTFSSRSSTYYAAAGNARARAKKASLVLKPFWLAVGILCFSRSLRLSNCLVQKIGLAIMTPDQLDVRSHILRKVRKHEKALECVEEALKQNFISPNSQVLLLMGKAESLTALSEIFGAERAYKDAFNIAEDEKVPESTKVRLLRSFATFECSRGKENEACQLLRRARVLAVEESLEDQVKKIEASL